MSNQPSISDFIKRGNEIVDFHPLVERCLRANGYEVQHEVSMGNAGRVDFIAKNAGATLLVEAKLNPKKSKSGVGQLLLYHSQLPDARMVLAVPDTGVIPESLAALCDQHNIRILGIKISDTDMLAFQERLRQRALRAEQYLLMMKSIFDEHNRDVPSPDDYSQIISSALNLIERQAALIEAQDHEINRWKKEYEGMKDLFLDVIEDQGGLDTLYAIACEVLQ
jgi:hypothetical protein